MQRNEAAVREVLKAETPDRTPGAEARVLLARLAIGGGLPFVVGLTLMLVKWPHTAINGAGQLMAAGSPTSAAWGAALAVFAALPVIVVLVAIGVQIGLRAAKD